jgi:hypothetical protein
MVTNTLWLWGVPKCKFVGLLPPPFHMGLPTWLRDCVFGYPFRHALKNIFFAKASHVHTERPFHFAYGVIAHSH